MPRDPLVAKALTGSCTLVKDFKDGADRCKEKGNALSVDRDDLAKWRKLAVECNKALASQERQLHKMQTEYETKLQMMKAEMRAELIDREGNAARVAEKQRTLVESQHRLDKNQMTLYDRVKMSVGVIESTLNELASVVTPGPAASTAVAVSAE